MTNGLGDMSEQMKIHTYIHKQTTKIKNFLLALPQSVNKLTINRHSENIKP